MPLPNATVYLALPVFASSVLILHCLYVIGLSLYVGDIPCLHVPVSFSAPIILYFLLRVDFKEHYNILE